MLPERWNTNSDENIIIERIKEYVKSGLGEENIIEIDRINEDYGQYNIMFRNGDILEINKYKKMIDEGKVNCNDTYVFVATGLEGCIPIFLYPFIHYSYIILDAYISKLGLYNYGYYFDCEAEVDRFTYYSVPAISLKYVALQVKYREYSAIELVDLDTVVNNTHLRDIVNQYNIVNNELNNCKSDEKIDETDYTEIRNKFGSQKPFVSDDSDFYTDDPEDILYDYYVYDKKTLEKKVTEIIADYNRILKPYRVCFETKNWSRISCSDIRFAKSWD